MHKAGVDALLITDFVNVTYLTGFTGDDSYLLVAGGGDLVVSDGRYTTQLSEECPGLETHIRPSGTSMPEAMGKVLRSARLKRLGIEGDSISLTMRDRIAEARPGLELVRPAGWSSGSAKSRTRGKSP